MSKGIQIIKENNNLAEWSRQVEEFRNSGLSVRSWCEQHQISKKKTFGSSSERMEDLYAVISLLFNEAELIDDIENKTTETTVKEHTRKKKAFCFD